MTNKGLTINENFWHDFPKIYKNSSLIDKYLQDRSNFIENIVITKFNDLGLGSDYSIYANGGFGRKEMFPSSDVDLSIIKHSNKVKKSDSLEKFIANLWDEGLKIGHSVRTLKDIKIISSKDPKEFTSYLTRRPLIAKKGIDNEIKIILNQAWKKKKFFNAKSDEQKNRHESFFSTEFNLEPDLKESPGTLRDFQTALWILQHCFDLENYSEIKKSKEFKNEIDSATSSYNFIKTLRFATNILNKRNRLNFETQIDISQKAKIKESTNKKIVEKMMQEFYSNASVISDFNNLVFESFIEKNTFSLTKDLGELYTKGNKVGIKKGPLSERKNLIFEVFIVIGKSKKIKAIDTPSMALLKKNVHLIDKDFKNNSFFASQFLKILRSKHNLSSILKTMKNLGILQAYIHEFSEVVGQMQFDLFHVYTVDEHTFKVVRNMRQLKILQQDEFKLEHELINKLPKIEILYLAGLFHDLGKGKGGDHSEIGAQTSKIFARKIGLSIADANLISWLVLNHLQMSSISQKKDISDPETIKSFAEIVLNSERLDYLYLLTVNDIRATNPALWNGWKHGLLKDLFLLTRSRLNKEPIKTSEEITKDRKKSVLEFFDISLKEDINEYLQLFDDSYFNKNTSDKLKWQSSLVLKEKSNLTVGCRKCFNNLVEVFVKVENSEGLFLKLVKVLESSGLEIIDASIFTSSNKEIAANTFITKFSHHNRSLNINECKEVAIRIKENFNNYSVLKTKPLARKEILKSFKKSTSITSIEEPQKGKNLLTIETSDSPGLLGRIAQVFKDNDVSIYSARINTLGDSVEDTFEIEDTTSSSVPLKKINKISRILKETI